MPDATWTESDTEAMLAAIGRYVIVFQWIESKLDQVLLLGWGYENWAASQAKLAKMTNFEKVNAVKDIVLNSPNFARVHSRPDWCEGFESLVARIHEERNKRNSLVHSQYLFEFVEAGMAPLRSRREKENGAATFDQEPLTKAVQERLLRDLGELAMAVNLTLLQLIHDYQAPTDSTSKVMTDFPP